MLPIIAFRKGTSLKQITGTNTIHNNEKLIKTKINHHTGKCVPCNSTRCLCCQQLISTRTFKSNQTNKAFKIYHRVNCKSSFVIYLQNAISATFNMLANQKHHSTLCSITTEKMSKITIQYQLANISTSTIMTLTITEIIIEQLRNIRTTSTETLKERLKQRENFWIMKLETLAPLGLNQDLN